MIAEIDKSLNIIGQIKRKLVKLRTIIAGAYNAIIKA